MGCSRSDGITIASNVSSQVMAGNEGGYGVSDRRALLMTRNITRTKVESTPCLLTLVRSLSDCPRLRPKGCTLTLRTPHSDPSGGDKKIPGSIHGDPDLLYLHGLINYANSAG